MGDWMKIRNCLVEKPEFQLIADRLGISEAEVLLHLYSVAGWFSRAGKHGKMKMQAELIDTFLRTTGVAAVLMEFGWVRVNGGVVSLHHFCDVSATRKKLGAKLRKEILSSGQCVACGSTDELVIDHKTPVCRGGLCERENFQVLCAACNRSKGRKTMAEWEASR